MKALPADDLQSIAQATRHVWEAARGKTIFLTGGTGFFGCWLIESFLACKNAYSLDTKLIALSRNPEHFLKENPQAQDPSITWIKGDMADFAFPDEAVHYCLHAATDVSQRSNEQASLPMFRSITAGTERVIELCHAKQCEHLLLVSSGAVYGVQPPEITHLSESYRGAPDPLDNNSAYGEAKRVSEYLAAQLAKTSPTKVKIARCFAFVGPGLALDSVYAIGNFIGDALNERSIALNGDGSPYRSYLYTTDLTIQLWMLLFSENSPSVYNIGSSDAKPLREVAQIVVDTLNPSLTVTCAKEMDSSKPPSRYVPDVSRIHREFSLPTPLSLTEALIKTASWHRSLSHEQR